ncbi:DUF5302 domain-containing protein [Georgenia faecalis]|uniref:DUF5302 domain-containing protein n=1 Tax=Georgenia faecalis TaxID=2483799 RepID=A0ABV9D990_9MICO|nr:DUF5302 domain-containing protein [Georgenia faecalis]
MPDTTPDPTPDAPADQTEQVDAVEDAKTKMRAALDRKRANGHLTAEGRANTGRVHGSEVAGSKRVFRRKSG